mmetsp:Transcript_2685/g.10731  ORF Transcript_2685/g.10731 Transcript_2685/m.10731 type:complete len:355 (-) Transcript_2685:150-1214(-)
MVALRASTLALALALAAPSSSVLAAPIANTADLYSTIASEGGLVGFLSDANYASVSHVLPPRAEGDAKVPGKTTVAIFEDQADLLEAVRSGTLLAGSLSGPPEDSEGLVVFSSEAISPRAMMLMPSRVCDDAVNGTNATYTSSVHMAAAVNAAIANVVASGGFAELLDASSPFYVASAAPCAAAPDLFPYPVAANVPATDVISDVFQSGVLKLAALGPFDWGLDGNYTASPPTGFWPGYVGLLLGELRAGLGLPLLELQRVYAPSSDEVIELVLSGAAHATEPYMTTGAFYPSTGEITAPRQEATHMSCTTAGYEPVFLSAQAGAGCAGIFDVNCDGVVNGTDVQIVASKADGR